MKKIALLLGSILMIYIIYAWVLCPLAHAVATLTEQSIVYSPPGYQNNGY
jgi:hypothetical protein